MTTTTIKRCKSCGDTKPIRDFYSHPTSGPFARCRQCCIEARKAAYRADPQKTKDQVARARFASKVTR